MAYYNGKKVLSVVDYKPAILIEKEITKGGEYNASDDNADGYSKVIVGAVKPEGNLLQYVIDNQGGDGKPSCYYLFYYYKGTSLDKAIEGLDTSKVTNFSYMFNYCSNLTSVPQLDTSNGTNFSYMFYSCSNLTSVPQLDTSKGNNFSYMFASCSNLTSMPQLDTSNGTIFYRMFQECTNLTSVPALDTSKGTDFNNMFRYCSKLTSVPALDTSKGTDFNNMFYSCNKLTSIGIYGFTRSIDITTTALNHDALVAFLNQAGTAYNSSQKITMGSAKLVLLSDEEKAIATNKGWTLA